MGTLPERKRQPKKKKKRERNTMCGYNGELMPEFLIFYFSTSLRLTRVNAKKNVMFKLKYTPSLMIDIKQKLDEKNTKFFRNFSLHIVTNEMKGYSKNSAAQFKMKDSTSDGPNQDHMRERKREINKSMQKQHFELHCISVNCVNYFYIRSNDPSYC